MISTNFKVLCGSPEAQSFTIDFPVGFVTPTILIGPDGLEMSPAGEITCTLETPTIIVLLISYFIGEGPSAVQFIEPFYIQIENCATEPVKTSYTVCIGTGDESVLFKTSPSYNDYQIVTPVGGITVNTNGVIEIVTDGLPEAGVTIQIEYNGNSESSSVFIQAVECPLPDLLSVADCPYEPIGIVWINQTGGRQSYWFNSPKTFSIDQNDSEQFINSSNELRYFNRGRVEDMIFVNEDYIPESHLPALTSLKNSIQVWACTDMEDAATYKSIILDEGSFEIRKTNSRFFAMDFTFKYSKQIKIQRQ